MAVVLEGAPRVSAPPRQPKVRDFLRLKLRLLRNGFRGQPWRVVAFVIGLGAGLFFALVGALGLAASGTAPDDVGYLVAVFAGAFVVLGWTIVPLLFFGVDETLDPARFALLPVRPAVLARGMLAAAFIGIPAVVSLVATAGLVVAAGLRSGLLAAAVALLGVVAGLTVGIVASRAVTSAFAALLRSRRVRDLAAVMIALLAASIGPIQWVGLAAFQSGTVDQAVRVAEVLAWTPLGAPYAIPFDVAAGDWSLVAARVAITLATILLLLWWWSHTIEPAMLDSSSGGSAKATKASAGGAVGALIPAPIRRLARPGPFSAIMSREARFWWRDGRRRAGLVSILVTSAVLPIALNIGAAAGRPGQVTGLSTAGFSFAITLAGTMGGMLLGNQFGYDGSAFAAHLLTRVPGRTELRARAAGIGVVAIPVQVAVVVVVAVITGQVAYLPSGLGLLAAAFGAAVAASALVSVLAPYPLPESSNPFAVSSGGGTAKGMLAFVALLVTLIVASPIAVLAFVFGSSVVWSWALLAIGLAYGVGASWAGTYIAGDLVDRRGPEILAAVTPKR